MNLDGPPLRGPMVDSYQSITLPWLKWFQRLVMVANQPLPVYANNAAALAGGLSGGDKYRTGGDPDHVCVVH